MNIQKKTINLTSKLIVLMSLVGLISCGKSEEISSGSQGFSYEIDDNGCKTGSHNFSSKKDYCIGLNNDELNDFCAYRLREIKYENESCQELTNNNFGTN